MTEHEMEPTKAKPRGPDRGYRPFYAEEAIWGGFLGPRDKENAPFRTYKAMLPAAILFVVVLAGVVLFVMLH
jgi:hypothetical protein